MNQISKFVYLKIVRKFCNICDNIIMLTILTLSKNVLDIFTDT